MPWKLSLFGEEYDGGTLTVDDYIELEERTKLGWNQITPFGSAKMAKTVAAFMYAKRANVSFDDAEAKVGSVPADEYIDKVNFYALEADDEAPDPPKAGKP